MDYKMLKHGLGLDNSAVSSIRVHARLQDSLQKRRGARLASSVSKMAEGRRRNFVGAQRFAVSRQKSPGTPTYGRALQMRYQGAPKAVRNYVEIVGLQKVARSKCKSRGDRSKPARLLPRRVSQFSPPFGLWSLESVLSPLFR